MAIFSVIGMPFADKLFSTASDKALHVFDKLSKGEIELFKEFLHLSKEINNLNMFDEIVRKAVSQNEKEFEFIFWNEKYRQFGTDRIYVSDYVNVIMSKLN